MFFRVLHKVLYHENGKMKLLCHRDNGKIGRISRSRDTLNSNPGW